MKKWITCLLLILSICIVTHAQTAEELITQLRQKVASVNDYEAQGRMKTNVSFIKAPEADVKVFFKKPNKLRIRNATGISFIPKGSLNINLGSIFDNSGNYDIIDVGKESGTGLRIVKLLPQDENAEVVLSTLYIDEKLVLIKKAKVTTRESGTYELQMTYGRYASYGLADKVTFTFNTKDYKLPKGVTLDYDDGSGKNKPTTPQDKKGSVEISYSEYKINKGVADSVFE
jgi:outer membrane lipoprotein-sorting protein